ncbi:MAG TPA: DUF4097 family beta strand repeat-containing protein [Bryobacteraceae bacterium]
MKRLALLAAVLAATLSPLAARAEVRAEFHQVYPLEAGGRVAVRNINGSIQVAAWERNEVKVDAVKRGRSQQDLDEARIVVDASAGKVDIRTKYPERENNQHAASVEYTITVPRGASLDRIEAVNGDVAIEGIAGAVRVNSVNGKVDVRRAGGDVDASTVNGRVEAAFESLSSHRVSLNTVNGGILLALPKDAGAHLKASTVHGDISSDFGLTVRHAGFAPGNSLDTTIGAGGADVKLATVNGAISLTRR